MVSRLREGAVAGPPETIHTPLSAFILESKSSASLTLRAAHWQKSMAACETMLRLIESQEVHGGESGKGEQGVGRPYPRRGCVALGKLRAPSNLPSGLSSHDSCPKVQLGLEHPA